MRTLKDQARSIGAKLSKLSKTLDVAYENILTEFLLERLAVRLISSPDLEDRFVFKGGYVSLRVYQSPRYTIDLDALLKRGNLDQVTPSIKKATEKDVGDGVWFRLESTVDLKTQGEYGGIRFVFRTGIGEVLPNLKRAQIVHLDVGIGDPVTPAPLKKETPFMLGEGKLSWQVYPVETVVAEKLHALVVRYSESSRSKDVFDLDLLLPKCKISDFKTALEVTFKYRGDAIPEDLLGFLKKIDRSLLRQGWVSAVESIPSVSEFDDVFERVLKHLSVLLK